MRLKVPELKDKNKINLVFLGPNMKLDGRSELPMKDSMSMAESNTLAKLVH